MNRSTVMIATALTVSLAGTTAVAAAAPGGKFDLVGGKSVTVLDKNSSKALAAANVTLKATGKADLKKNKLTLPITDGTYNGGKGTINHTGGIKFSNGAGSVKITDVSYTFTNHTGTAKVSGEGRIKAFDLGDPNSGGPVKNGVMFAGYTVTIAKPLEKVLDAKLDVGNLFKKDAALLGVGITTVKYAS